STNTSALTASSAVLYTNALATLLKKVATAGRWTACPSQAAMLTSPSARGLARGRKGKKRNRARRSETSNGVPVSRATGDVGNGWNAPSCSANTDFGTPQV